MPVRAPWPAWSPRGWARPPLRCRWTDCTWPTWNWPGSARLDRKGAPDTFDAFGYVALLRRLRAAEPGEVVYAPAFERTMEQPVAGSIAIDPSVPLVVTEGNYLLLPDAPWDRVRPLLDEAWYIEAADDEVRFERLIERHIAFGKTPEAAGRWARGSDEVNARLIARSRDRADLIVTDDVLKFPD